MFKTLNRDYRGRLVFTGEEISPKIVVSINLSTVYTPLLRNLQFDPVQWQKDHSMLQRQSLVENLSSFVDTKPPKRCSDVAAATESTTTTCMFPKAVTGYPELSDEPNSHLDKSVLCRIFVRLPDGRRVQKSFLKSESVQLLLSFCYSQSQIDQSERNKPFKLFQTILVYYKNLYYGSYTSFEQSGLANSLVSVTWM
ncbi:unnamed protein product [Brassica oleracea var. botrytis]